MNFNTTLSIVSKIETVAKREGVAQFFAIGCLLCAVTTMYAVFLILFF